MAEPILDPRTLNRTLLARQHLLERTSADPIAVMREMGYIQMQYAPAGYIGLWSRVRGFRRLILTRLLEDRVAVQGTMLRSTIHTVPADEYWPVMAATRRSNREWLSRAQGPQVGSTDMAALARAIREELADGPLRVAELSERLDNRGFPPRALTWASPWVEMLRIPPSGTWERRRADLYGLAEWWLGPAPEIAEDDGTQHLIRRYLGAFGPAAPKEISLWMRVAVSRLRPVLDRMELRRYRDEAGRRLVDLPDAEIVDGATPAPVRFLPVWDATLLVHARRTQILPEEHRPRIFNTKMPHSFNTVLVDGQVAGTWRVADGRLEVEPFRPLRPAERAAIDEEGAGLVALHADE